jgi:hypothetical protein
VCTQLLHREYQQVCCRGQGASIDEQAQDTYAAAASPMSSRKWNQRLLVSALMLPVSLPLLIVYLVATTCMVMGCLLVDQALCRNFRSHRRRCSNKKRKQQQQQHGEQRAAPCSVAGGGSNWHLRCLQVLLCRSVGVALKILSVTNWAWLPIWRACTKRGTHRCSYVALRAATGRGGNNAPGIASRSLCPVDGLPPKPRHHARLVFLSDTHGNHDWVEVPDGDVLLHCGDIAVGWHNRVCPCRRRKSLDQFDAWLGTMPHQHKIIIGGNHDEALDRRAQELRAADGDGGRHRTRDVQPFAHATYLENSGAVLAVIAGCQKLRVWGTPWSPDGTSSNRAFRPSEYATQRQEWMAAIPSGVDVLLSHAAVPAQTLHRVSPRLAASGHYHFRHGVQYVTRMPHMQAALGAAAAATNRPFQPPGHSHGSGGRCDVNAAICDENYAPTQPVIVVDLPLQPEALEMCSGNNGEAKSLAEQWALLTAPTAAAKALQAGRHGDGGWASRLLRLARDLPAASGAAGKRSLF